MATVVTQNYGLARLVNRNELELERFDSSTDDDAAVLPFYRIPLTGEHLAAWAVNALRLAGCTCKRLTSGVITAGVRRATRKDPTLVYYCSTGSDSATIVREGRERVLTFEFDARADEEDFILYITGFLQ